MKATVSADQGGPHAGEVVEVLADDYAAKGDEELVEVKIGDDLIFVEKKYIKLGAAAMDKATEPEASEEPVEEPKVEDPEKKNPEMLDEDDFSFDMEDDVKDEEEAGEEDEEISIEDLDDDGEEKEISIEDLEEPETTECPVCHCDPCECQPGETTDIEKLRAKLKKSLAELEGLRSDMSSTFTSTDTISLTIQNLRGMLDALKKDQMNILTSK